MLVGLQIYIINIWNICTKNKYLKHKIKSNNNILLKGNIVIIKTPVSFILSFSLIFLNKNKLKITSFYPNVLSFYIYSSHFTSTSKQSINLIHIESKN